jgi:transcriptional regulator with XRE-family HTH domain
MEVGGKIREIRQEVGITLEELSKKSGIALATLSRIENGKMTGTLQSHMKICKALGVALPRLYAGLVDEKREIDVQKKTLRTEVFLHNKKSSSEMLTSKVLDKKMMPVMVKILPHGATDKEENKLNTEKFIFVLEGEIEAVIGAEKYKIKKGDTLYFNASFPHQLKNIGKSEAHCICIISPPAL